MAASSHLGLCRKWNLTTTKVATDLYVHLYQIWLRYDKGSRVTAIYDFIMAPRRHFGFPQKLRFCFWDVCCPWTKFRMNMCNSDLVTAVRVNFQNNHRRHLGYCRKWNLTEAEVAADMYLSPYQIRWIYIKGMESYSDLCVSKWQPNAIWNFRRS